jgi:hypothetical protein
MKNTAPRKPSAKRPRKSGTPGSSGNLTNPEKQKLVLQAKEAWGYQLAVKAIPANTSFDEFRSTQVEASVGLSGISKLNRSHWRTVSAHFLTLAGREDEAFDLLNKTGEKTYRGGNPGDTWETAEAYVHQIRQALTLHGGADLAEGMSRIETGWFLAAARQRTQKPSLTMDTLAERLDPQTLRGLLSHLRNHISRREGREDITRRSIRKYADKPDPGQLDDPF